MSARYEFQDNGPIYARDLFPGADGGRGDQRPFRRDIAERIRSLYMSSPMVSTAVNQLVSYLTRTTIVIEGADAKMISEEQIKYEIQPAVNQMMLEWILYGYTNVCKGKSTVTPGRSTINVVPFSMVQQTMEWDDDWRVTYKAETSAQIGERKKKNTKIRVLCMYPPNEHGVLTSPLAHCITHLGYGEHLWTTYMTGSERGINPTFIFTQQQRTTGTLPGVERLPLNSSIITSGGLGQVPMDKIVKAAETDAAEHTKKVLDDARTQRSEALAQQRAVRENVAKATSNSGVTFSTDDVLPSGLRGNMSVDPLGNLYLAPAGHSFTAGPDFKTPAEFTRVLEIVAEELYRALGLPIIMLRARADTSSSVEFALRSLDSVVTEIQKRASTLISEALNQFIGPDIERERIESAMASDVIAIAESSSSSTPSPPTSVSKVQFNVTFPSSPITTFELAQQIHASGIMSDEFFQEWVLAILNLPDKAKRDNIGMWLNEQRDSKRQRTT